MLLRAAVACSCRVQLLLLRPLLLMCLGGVEPLGHDESAFVMRTVASTQGMMGVNNQSTTSAEDRRDKAKGAREAWKRYCRERGGGGGGGGRTIGKRKWKRLKKKAKKQPT